jgi:hypothetical protein
MCFVIYLLLICAYSQGKRKKRDFPTRGSFFLKKKTHSSPSAREGALGEGYFFKKNKGSFPECQSIRNSGKTFSKKINFFPECCTRGRGFKKKEISSPGVALREE